MPQPPCYPKCQVQIKQHTTIKAIELLRRHSEIVLNKVMKINGVNNILELSELLLYGNTWFWQSASHIETTTTLNQTRVNNPSGYPEDVEIVDLIVFQDILK